VFREVARPVRGRTIGAASRTALDRSLNVAEFDPKPREHRDRVHDKPAVIAGMMTSFVGIRLCLDCTVHADQVVSYQRLQR